MPNYQTTVNRIKDIVIRKIPVDPAEAAVLAADYAVIANEAVRRLDEICDHLNRGLRSEAIHLAETPPALLDVLAALDFDGLDVWTGHTVSNNLPVPPTINAGKIQTLQEAYGKHEALEPMQKVYRKLSVKGGSTAEKIAIVRRIKALDPGNSNWGEDLKALEVARCKEIGELLRKPDGISEDIAAEWVKELTDKQLLVLPGEQLINFAKEIHLKLKSARVHQAMENLLNRLNVGTAANDYDRVSGTLSELDDLVKKEGVSVPAERTSLVEDARYWFNERKAQREAEASFTADMGQLSQLLQSAGDVGQVRQLVAKHAQREFPDGLRARAQAYVSKHDSAVALKKNLRLAGIGGAVLAGVLLVLWIVLAISSSQKRSAIAAQIRHYTETADFGGGQRYINTLNADAPTLLDDPGISHEVQAFNQAKNEEGARQKRLEVDLEIAAKIDEPFAPNLDIALAEAEKLVRSDEEKAKLAETKANLESVRFKRKDENVRSARNLMSEVTDAYKAAQGVNSSDNLKERLVKMDELLLKLEGYQGLKDETELLGAVRDFRKRYGDEKVRLERLITKEDKDRAQYDKIQKDLLRACQKLPDLAAYAEELAHMAETYGEIPETEALQQWKVLAPAYRAVADYGEAVKPLAVKDVPDYPKYMGIVLKLPADMPDTPYMTALKQQRFIAAFHTDYQKELAELMKVLNHELMTKMYEFDSEGKIYYTAKGESKLNVGDGKIQVKAFLDDSMKPKTLLPKDPATVSDIVIARHCELAEMIRERLKECANKKDWSVDFPALVRDVVNFKDVNAWVHALVLQKLVAADQEKFRCLNVPAALQTDIDALSTDKLNFWMTDDANTQDELKKIADRFNQLKPKLTKFLDEISATQPARAKADSVALTRPLVISAVLMRDLKSNRVAHDIGGQTYREYWAIVLKDKLPHFRIAAAVGSDGQLVWYHPEQLAPGQPLLSPLDSKTSTEEMFERYVKNCDSIPQIWPLNICELKKN